MSIHSRMVEPIVVLKPSAGTEDVYGNTRDGEPTSETYQGLCWQGDSTEVLDTDGNTVITSWQLYIEARSDLKASMKVQAHSKVFEVIGTPAPFNRPGSPPTAIRAFLRHIEDL